MGHPGNERVDELARDADKLQLNTEGIVMSCSYFKGQLTDVTYKLWADE